jgi:hypothetical protein
MMLREESVGGQIRNVSWMRHEAAALVIRTSVTSVSFLSTSYANGFEDGEHPDTVYKYILSSYLTS